MGRFDRLEARLHKSAANAFGYSALWLPSVGGEAQTVEILFKDPNKKGTQAELDNVDYRDVSPIMEYHGNEFPGLRELANTGSHVEGVTINKGGVDYFYRVAAVEKLHDGDTYYAYLVQVSAL